MDAIKSSSLSYSKIKQPDSGIKKSLSPAKNTVKQESDKPSFGASLHPKESFFKKMKELPHKGIDKFQRLLESRGFIAEFLTVDLIGMVIPRTIQAYNRNKEELGHPNYAAAKEEFTREILSGPSMFIIPFTFLAASKKMFGASSHVKLDTLKKFKDITINALEKTHENNESLVKNFYDGLVEKLYGPAIEIDKDSKTNIINKLVAFHNAKPEETGRLGKEAKNALISANKKIGNEEEMGISMADSSSINFEKISKSVGSFVEECRNYSTDVINIVSEELTKKPKNVSETLIEDIHEFKEGARKLLTTVSVGSIAAFLWIIPKLYNQNKVYPGLAGLTNTNDKNNARLQANELPAKMEESKK